MVKTEKTKMSVMIPVKMRDEIFTLANEMGLSVSALAYTIFDQYMSGRSILEKLPEMIQAIRKADAIQQAKNAENLKDEPKKAKQIGKTERRAKNAN